MSYGKPELGSPAAHWLVFVMRRGALGRYRVPSVLGGVAQLGGVGPGENSERGGMRRQGSRASMARRARYPCQASRCDMTRPQSIFRFGMTPLPL